MTPDGEYFNTNALNGAELARARSRNGNQEQHVLDIFRSSASGVMTPEDVRARYPVPTPPLTSIRRAMTCLAARGELVKTSRMRHGCFGSPIHYWSLPGGQQELQL